MVTVVSTVPHPSVVKEVVCRNCGSTLSYVPKDIKEQRHYDYGGGSDNYYYIECPSCNDKVFVNRY